MRGEVVGDEAKQGSKRGEDENKEVGAEEADEKKQKVEN